MGRWMEVVRAQRDHGSSREENVVGEIAPNPLIDAFHALCQGNPGKGETVRKHFPMLEAVGTSDRYADEEMSLQAEAIERLLGEFQRLRRICRREEFITGLDGPSAYGAWRTSWQPEEFERWLDSIEKLLEEAAASGHSVRLLL